MDTEKPAAAAAAPQTTSAPQGQAAAPSSEGGAPTGPAAAEVSVHATGAGGDWESPEEGDDSADENYELDKDPEVQHKRRKILRPNNGVV
eukprot:COSAG01_NODE_9796_length_2341_cov_3.745317_3_plen_90_part_00